VALPFQIGNFLLRGGNSLLRPLQRAGKVSISLLGGHVTRLQRQRVWRSILP
jgi:hypothetical protein